MSLSKNKISYIQSLKDKKNRSQTKTFVAEGSKLIFDLLQTMKCQVLVVSEPLNNHIPSGIIEEIIIASPAELKKASHLSTPPDAIAVFYQNHQQDVHINYGEKLNLVLDTVQDPGNLGTIIRIADWFGIETIFCSEGTVDAYNSKTVQATMGALARVNVVSVDIVNLLKTYSDSPIYGTFLNGENVYDETLTNTGFIVLGNEGNGIRADVEKLMTRRLYIPHFSAHNITSESLNVAVAAAIICSEFRRRSFLKT